MKDPAFVHRLAEPEGPASGETYLLMHGTGGDETDLAPLARRIAPGARLLGIRGRSLEEGSPRWFRRLSMARFDQAHIRAEAQALADFLAEARKAYGLDPERMVWLGYSNGANMIGAMAFLHPQTARRAILMRAMPALEAPPQADLSGFSALSLSGAQDPYGAHAPALEADLRKAGARVEAHRLPAGHGLTAEDLRLAQDWSARGLTAFQP